MDKNEKKKFIARAVAWVIAAGVMPVAFIGWRYGLFEKVGTLQLSGWGMFAIVILFVFLYVLARYIKAGFVEWSMTKQIITGITKVLIPLGAVLWVCMTMRTNLDYFIQSLSCTIVCEAIAIPINPFPKWIYEKSQGRFESALEYVTDRLTKKEEDK